MAHYPKIVDNSIVKVVHYTDTYTYKGDKMSKNSNPNSDYIFPQLPKMPELKVSKNGYEIRTEVLSMAKELVQSEFQSKFYGWEISNTRDEKTGQFVTTVGMPEYPGLDKVLETAEKMYAFINSGIPRK